MVPEICAKFVKFSECEWYHIIFVNQMWPSLEYLFPEGGAIFQSDINPKRTVGMNRCYFEPHNISDAVAITVTPRPPQPHMKAVSN